MARYLQTTNHSEELVAALEGFHRALTRRWRIEVTEAILENRTDFPTAIRRDTPAGGPRLWDFSSLAARYHLGEGSYPVDPGPGGYCAYVAWVLGGQNGALSGVVCEGLTGQINNVAGVPGAIVCGIGTILAQVEEWAWAERMHAFARMPLFDRHDLGLLERAHDILIDLGGRLGLVAAAGSEAEPLRFFDPDVRSRTIPGAVTGISSADLADRDWRVGWTGLAADRARDGFFASVEPTMDNQAGIAGCLANLYSHRAAIIEKGRNDGLYWTWWATASLYASEVEVADHAGGWKVVQAVGLGVELTLGWTGVGAGVGTAVSLVGFLGELLVSEIRQEEFRYDLVETVTTFHDNISRLGHQLDGLENDYYTLATQLDSLIYHTHSYNLELYDLTRNDPEGSRQAGETGYQVDVDDVLSLARACYELGEEYELLLPVISGTREADGHLADRDGTQTRADRRVLAARDQLHDFVETSCARYVLAGDQLRNATESYVEEDETQRDQFARTMDDWDAARIGRRRPELDIEDTARETERLGRPGEGDNSRDYAVEGDP